MQPNCSSCEVFVQFSGVKADIKNLKNEDKELWQGIVIERQRIDGIKNWVIAGMGSMILNLLGTISALFFLFLKLKGVP